LISGRLPLDALLVGAGAKEAGYSSKCPPGKHWRNERSKKL
jgi:hypothetical protein